MSKIESVVKEAENLFLEEYKQTGMPTKDAFYIALKKGIELADRLGADKTIVQVGIFLMDLKLGQAWKEKRGKEHAQMSVDAARKFLNKFDVSDDFKKKVLNCIEAHHHAVPYKCLEAEICSNADNFQFLNPRGFLFIFAMFIELGRSFDECIKILDSKIEEKYQKTSLDICKKEAEEYYQLLKKLINSAQKGT